MKLSVDDAKLFYKLHPALVFYANQQMKEVENVSTLEKFMALPLENKVKIRNALYDKIDLIDLFVKENPFNLSEEELEIVQGWKNLTTGSFYLVRYLKKYAVFLEEGDPPRAYGVLSLTDELEDIVGPHLPIYIKTVLLPFKGKIIYDGLMNPYRITFGGGYRRSLNNSYQESKARYGIITSLPFSKEGEEPGDEEMLRFYLKNQHNREMYREEIDNLKEKNQSLLVLYHQEMGKVHARSLGKHLRKIGLRKAWFAILDGIIVAGGPTKKEVEKTLEKILPPDKMRFAYFYHLKR